MDFFLMPGRPPVIHPSVYLSMISTIVSIGRYGTYFKGNEVSTKVDYRVESGS
jgi:hypothetical protein